MKRTWEQEKEYTRRRAQQLGAEMEKAIKAIDRDRFFNAYTTSMRYMKKKERSPYYRRFIERYAELMEQDGTMDRIQRWIDEKGGCVA